MVLGLEAQTKPCLRVAALISTVSVVSMFYILGFNQPMQFVRPVLLPIFTAKDDNTTPVSVKEGYLIWSPSCQIPDMDPHHHSIRNLLKPATSIVCSRYGPLTYIKTPTEEHAEGDLNAPYILQIDPGMIHHYIPSKHNFSCCYADVTRPEPDVKNNKTADNVFKIGKCVNFKNKVSLSVESEFILVKCNIYKKDGKEKEVYSNMHATVPMKPHVKNKMVKQDKQKLSIFFIGVDSISRLNLIRTMPKTVAHLHQNGWIELKGYNKVADNTFPNLMAILTGLSLDQVKSLCWHSKDSPLDPCPYIWNEFSKQGYITAFGEDITKMSTFNYQKTGFIKPPTDYYLRPYVLTAEKKLKLKTRDQLDICLGPTSTTEHLLRYATDFASTFRHALYFALLWINNLGHNNHNTPAAMDFRFLQFFNELLEMEVLNNTMIIFLSDHGMRFGKIRETFIGWLEERLPFMYIWVPKWYRYKYPEAFRNILNNADRLTSPYDVHLTLQDILARNTGNVEPNHAQNKSEGCSKCVSLFDEVKYNRTCEDAGITPHWCTCNQYETLSNVGDTVESAAKFVVSEIQKRLQKSVNRTQKSKKCADLRLNRLINVRGRIQNNSKNKDYVMLIETTPGNALFEATVRRYVGKDREFEVMGIVSRINAYWGQSTCISDSTLKLYCYCVNS